MPVDLGRSVLTDDVTMREKVAASNLSVYLAIAASGVSAPAAKGYKVRAESRATDMTLKSPHFAPKTSAFPLCAGRQAQVLRGRTKTRSALKYHCYLWLQVIQALRLVGCWG